ncbi:hypothetical protein NPIL_256801 [Nephila pilipes]|uniref:Uncharacterized protein n=1 Tax=Nephila pilipes TaxID=299642 RepID=A0A8X6Q9H4_NEPPI|nr:hypothetical protein NPIL_256801 [Nephila pilipes]
MSAVSSEVLLSLAGSVMSFDIGGDIVVEIFSSLLDVLILLGGFLLSVFVVENIFLVDSQSFGVDDDSVEKSSVLFSLGGLSVEVKELDEVSPVVVSSDNGFEVDESSLYFGLVDISRIANSSVAVSVDSGTRWKFWFLCKSD